MYRRDVDQQIFEAIEAELIGFRRSSGAIDVTTGRHPVHGQVILVRQGDRHVAVVEEASALDLALVKAPL